MNKIKAILFIMIAISILSACGANKVALRPEIKNSIQHVSIVRVDSKQYSALDNGNIGMMFGGVGAGFAGYSTAKKGELITEIIKKQNYDFGKTLTQLVKNQLKNGHYKVSVIDANRPKHGKLLDNYSAINKKKADAILDISMIHVGYATEHPLLSPHWRPSAQLLVALVDPRTNEILFQDQIMYGYHNPIISATDIDAPKEYRFDNAENLFADNKKLVDGLRLCAKDIANHITKELRK